MGSATLTQLWWSLSESLTMLPWSAAVGLTRTPTRKLTPTSLNPPLKTLTRRSAAILRIFHTTMHTESDFPLIHKDKFPFSLRVRIPPSPPKEKPWSSMDQGFFLYVSMVFQFYKINIVVYLVQIILHFRIIFCTRICTRPNHPVSPTRWLYAGMDGQSQYFKRFLIKMSIGSFW